jgi:hypothetical protein
MELTLLLGAHNPLALVGYIRVTEWSIIETKGSSFSHLVIHEAILKQVPNSVHTTIPFKALGFLISGLAHGLCTGNDTALLFLLRRGLNFLSKKKKIIIDTSTFSHMSS